MSILIRGMEMPKSCGNCFFDTRCDNWRLRNWGAPPPDDCPLVEIPPHGRLIDAEPIMKFITDGLNSGEFGYDQIKVLAEIQYAPTIIPAEEG